MLGVISYLLRETQVTPGQGTAQELAAVERSLRPMSYSSDPLLVFWSGRLCLRSSLCRRGHIQIGEPTVGATLAGGLFRAPLGHQRMEGRREVLAILLVVKWQSAQERRVGADGWRGEKTHANACRGEGHPGLQEVYETETEGWRSWTKTAASSTLDDSETGRTSRGFTASICSDAKSVGSPHSLVPCPGSSVPEAEKVIARRS